MRIYDMKVCGFHEPLGFAAEPLRLSWKADETEAKKQTAARVTLYEGGERIYDSGEREDIDSLCFAPEVTLKPRTAYTWKVSVWADNGDFAEGESAFETGKRGEEWAAKWIRSDMKQNMNFFRRFSCGKKIRRARVYATALGVYELYVNGVKAGDEYLTPYYNGYDSWQQITAFDVTVLLREGENELRAMVGGGWCVSRFGLQSDRPDFNGLYADHAAFLAELRIEYEDGTETVIGTDENWWASKSRVLASSIYDGEVYDANADISEELPVSIDTQKDLTRLEDRLSLPLRVTERIRPVRLFKTPKGEMMIDLGQEITGWLEFVCRAPKGTKVKLSYSEILQQDCFYRDNLRSAKCEYTYISDGEERVARPYHTFFGFRLVKVEGIAEEALRLEDFTGCVLHSDIPRTAWIETSNPKVNRLALNALWGQRGNFVDVPTDCPQRDERLGWTGDAQAFSGTACFNMDCEAFFTKYLHDMLYEQQKRGGSVPHVVPSCGMNDIGGSCAWADAAAVIPWNLYLFYGDKELLKKTYPNMKAWVEWIRATDEKNGGSRLWNVGFHFADWLALDTKDGSVMGATDPYFIATGYYYYSTTLAWKAAKALGYAEDAARYEKLLGEIYDAIQREYFTPNGRMAQTTQTAYVCALFMRFAPEEHRAKLAAMLDAELNATNGELRTGFVGTAYLNRVLSNNGYNQRAYKLLLNENYPGWLYEVNMGATTVWERWNSVLPDGSISDTGMNSLNHYAYGAVMEWVYRDAAGINPAEDAPGFRRAELRPKPNYLLPRVKLAFESACGRYESGWEIQKDRFIWNVKVPFGCEAKAVFPNGDRDAIAKAHPELTVIDDGEVYAVLTAGTWRFDYKPVTPLHRVVSLDMPIAELTAIPEAVEAVVSVLPAARRFMKKDGFFVGGDSSLREAFAAMPEYELKVTEEDIREMEKRLAEVE